ncbi:MAG TPA: NAD-dependent epimerase/dehydratase family protein [Solirubrobacteraceae bacterium]
MTTSAFVTGGSGFIGGALVRRLVADGWTVRALARSDASADAVRERGAEPVRGELADTASMVAGAAGCEVAFHVAAQLGDWGEREDFERGNVTGTRNALAATRQAGVRRFVHVGTEAALLAGDPLVEVDERAPLRFDSPALYSSTKARAEEAVIEANRDSLETVVVRPRFVWGRGDTTLLPAMAELVRAGRFAWVGGGRQRTSTTHVDNAVEGLMLAAQRGAPGGVYFVTDGRPVVFRDFVTRLIETQGVTPTGRSVPAPVANAVATVGETAWRLLPLPGRPPLTRLAVWLSALETTIDITRARTELGYAPVRTIDEGLEELRQS